MDKFQGETLKELTVSKIVNKVLQEKIQKPVSLNKSRHFPGILKGRDKPLFFAAFLILTLTSLISAAASVSAAVYYVSPTGNDGNNGLTLKTSFRTIQKSASVSQPGDTIEIQPGIYNEQITITRSGLVNQLITFHANGQAIIDAQNTRQYGIKLDGADYIKIEGLAIQSALKNGILLDNQANCNAIANNTLHNNKESGIKVTSQSCRNTISNNTLHHNAGGANAYGYRISAIYIFGYSHYNTITGNDVYSNQSGIWLEGCSSNCAITGNKTHDNNYGGFILVGATNNNTIANNLSYNNKAFGLELGYSAKNNLVKNNTIYHNLTNGLQLNNAAANNTIKNNIIVNNGTANNHYGIKIEAGSGAKISYNDIYNSGKTGAQNYGGFASPGTGDISLDPYFKSTDPQTEDFLKLKSIAAGDSIDSPCVDAGDPSDAASPETSPCVDMGAYDIYSSKGDWGVVAYWPLDENTGTVASDTAAFKNHGTIYGAKWTGGISNTALLFDGIKDNIMATDSNSLDITGSLAISAWVKFSQFNSQKKSSQHILKKDLAYKLSAEYQTFPSDEFPQIRAGENSTPFIDTTTAKYNSNSAKFQRTTKGNSSLISRYIDLTGVTAITLQGYNKAENVIGGKESWHKLGWFGRWYDENKNQLQNHWPDLGQWQGTFDWTLRKKTITVPAAAKYYRILMLGLEQCTGQGWWDEIKITDQNGSVLFYTSFEDNQVWFKIYNPNTGWSGIPAAQTKEKFTNYIGLYDGKYISIYQNGTQQAKLKCQTPINISSTNVMLGEKLQGKIDEIKIYNRSLTHEEIARTFSQYDTTPPIIQITTPQDGIVARYAPITIAGTITDDNDTNPVVTVNGMPAAVIPAHAGIQAAFTADINLAHGQNQITAQATDHSDNTSRRTITITYKPNTPPAITQTTPQNNASFEVGQTIKITVIAQDADTDQLQYQFKIDGEVKQSWSPSSIYNWQTTTQDTGTHTITCQGKDNYGGASAKTITCNIIGITPPAAPQVTDDGDFTQNLTQLHATWQSSGTENGIAEYQYSIGTAEGAADVINWQTAGTQTQITHTGLTLTNGQTYYINVKAKNFFGHWSGTGTSNGITTDDGTTLLIKITSPKDNTQTNASQITISGAVNNTAATVTINGMPAAVIPAHAGIQAAFTAQITLTDGENIITAAAEQSSQAARDEITVFLDTTAPTITIFTPDENAETQSNIIYGRISNDTKTVTVNNISAALSFPQSSSGNPDTLYFIATPTLTDGENTITITATDTAGNTTQKTHTFIYNTDTPKITITTPQNNSTTNISPITVEATAANDITYAYATSARLQNGAIENNKITVENLKLTPNKAVVTLTGFDQNQSKHQDAIIIDTPELKHYELIKITGDKNEYDNDIPQAGQNQDLTVKLFCDNAPATNEEIIFSVQRIAYSGQEGQSVSPSFNGNPENSVYTDINGEATAVLTTDTNSDITNIVECFPTQNPHLKTQFSLHTKPGVPAKITKITNDTQTIIPGAEIPLTVQLTDEHSNPIPNEQINFFITQGQGLLSLPGVTGQSSNIQATTNYNGAAQIIFTAPNMPQAQTQITSQANTAPQAQTTFVITTSASPTVTVEDLFNAININAQKIQDQIIEVTMTSDDPDETPCAQYKIWQKDDLMKIQDLATGQTEVRPQLSIATTSQADTQIISYDQQANIYTVKTKDPAQTGQYPYTLTYIDTAKAVITKIETYYETEGITTLFTTEMSGFIQLQQANNVWVYNTKTEKIYQDNNLLSTTTMTVTTRQINAGLTDGDF